MNRIIVIDKQGEQIQEVEFSGGYNITVTNHHDGGRLKHINRLDNGKFGDKHWIKNYQYCPIAERLVEKFEELQHIRPKNILFIVEMEWQPKTGGKKTWIGRIKKAGQQFGSMTGYDYILELRNFYLERMSQQQIIALIYHELRHIDVDGNLQNHDIEDWDNMVATLGKDWATTKGSIPDLLDDDFEDWFELKKSAEQMNLFRSTPYLTALK